MKISQLSMQPTNYHINTAWEIEAIGYNNNKLLTMAFEPDTNHIYLRQGHTANIEILKKCRKYCLNVDNSIQDFDRFI